MDKFYSWVAWKLPEGLVKWAYIRLVAHASIFGGPLPEMDVVTALERWNNKTL